MCLMYLENCNYLKIQLFFCRSLVCCNVIQVEITKRETFFVVILHIKHLAAKWSKSN